jgi:uncharacterized protein (DUF1800 family)
MKRPALLVAALAIGLFSCRSGWSVDDPPPDGSMGGPSDAADASVPRPDGGGDPLTQPPTPQEAARFLNQATFGATQADIARVMQLGYAGWLEQQFALPRGRTHQDWYVEDGFASNEADYTDPNRDRESAAWFTRVVREPDQLRYRMAWALSQLFVVGRNKLTTRIPLWMDFTADRAFVTYRQFLGDMTFSPVMAAYLDYRFNSDVDGAPDQNYAREVMQLFSIGLWELNDDGTYRLDAAGQKRPTYTQADVGGLSQVFTGLYIATQGDRRGTCRGRTGQLETNEENMWHCEMSVWNFTSIKPKSYLGVSVPAFTETGDPADRQAHGRRVINQALDTLANHPNTPAFISKQLIQRFTTSNPSPAYVSRVSAVFKNNGAGVRGDLKAVLKQILLDPEARDPAAQDREVYGKIREPLLAIAQMDRVLRASDGKGNVWAGSPGCKIYQDLITELERPFDSPTVFNFYRPGYAPATGAIADRGLVAPEMQLVDTNSVTEWSRFVQKALERGGTGCARDAKRLNQFDFGELSDVASDANALADRVLLLLAPGVDDTALRPALVRAIESVPATDEPSRLRRMNIAVMLTMVSPEYRVQR